MSENTCRAVVIVCCLLCLTAHVSMSKFNKTLKNKDETVVTPPPAVTETEIDQLSAKMKTLIETQQNRLARRVVFADPGIFVTDGPKADIAVKLKYLRWQIEVSIMLQRMQNGEPVGGAAGMTIIGQGRPVGASNTGRK